MAVDETRSKLFALRTARPRAPAQGNVAPQCLAQADGGRRVHGRPCFGQSIGLRHGYGKNERRCDRAMFFG